MELRELTDHDIHVRSASMERVVRRWVRDGQDVEDIVQDTWLVALEQDRGRIERLDRWLSGVARLRALRFHRDTANQRAREAASARPDVAPSADEPADRNDTLGLLMHQIESLAEPYRTVLRMRYVDGVSIPDIAEARGIEPATVRTQLHRARRQLKDRWERSHLSRLNVWLFLAWDRLVGPRPLARVGVRAAIAATCVVAVAVPLRLLGGESDRETPPLSHATAAEVDRAPDVTTRSPVEASAPGASLADTVSSLSVVCTWEGTSEPAASVALLLTPADAAPDAPGRASLELETDADGRAVAPDLEPALWRVRPALGSPELVDLAPGRDASLRLTLPRAKPATITVVRRRDPLPEADVWISYPGAPDDGRVVGTTDEEGRLELETLDGGVWVCAKADGVASDRRLYQGSGRLRLSVPLSPAPLRGLVVDELGEPIAGARVSTISGSESVHHETRGIALASPPTEATTGEDGRFELPWWGKAMQVVVSAEGHLSQARLLSTRQGRDLRIVLERDLRPVPGRYDVLGRAVDARGTPLSDWIVHLTPRQGIDPLTRVIRLEPAGRRSARTDEEGRFRFAACPEGTQVLELVDPRDEGQRVFAIETIEPRDGRESLLRAASPTATGRMVGVVTNADECSYIELFLDSERLQRPIPFEVDEAGGFELSDLLPGHYRLICKRAQRPTQVIGEGEVTAGGTTDLGDLLVRFFGGLRIRLDAPEGKMPDKLHVVATYDSWILSEPVLPGGSNWRLENGYVIADEIPAGRWRVGVYAWSLATTVLDVDVGVDEEGAAAARLVPGGNRTLRFLPSRPFSATDTLRFEVWNESRRTSFSIRVPRSLGAGTLAISESLPAGPLFVSATTDSGLVGEAFLGEGEEEISVTLTGRGVGTSSESR